MALVISTVKNLVRTYTETEELMSNTQTTSLLQKRTMGYKPGHTKRLTLNIDYWVLNIKNRMRTGSI